MAIIRGNGEEEKKSKFNCPEKWVISLESFLEMENDQKDLLPSHCWDNFIIFHCHPVVFWVLDTIVFLAPSLVSPSLTQYRFSLCRSHCCRCQLSLDHLWVLQDHRMSYIVCLYACMYVLHTFPEGCMYYIHFLKDVCMYVCMYECMYVCMYYIQILKDMTKRFLPGRKITECWDYTYIQVLWSWIKSGPLLPLDLSSHIILVYFPSSVKCIAVDFIWKCFAGTWPDGTI